MDILEHVSLIDTHIIAVLHLLVNCTRVQLAFQELEALLRQGPGPVCVYDSWHACIL